jgi:single-stranded DNA-binding protein
MPKRGINVVAFSGEVVSEPEYSETSRDRVPCCTFLLRQQDKGRKSTTARINVYGGLVSVCRSRLRHGVYVVVDGEMMNRGKELTEVRASDLAFL